MQKSAGITRECPSFCRYARKYRHFADFADFAAKNALRTRFGFREARGIPYHFLISEGRV